MAEEKTYGLPLTETEWNVVLAGLSKLAWEVADPTIGRIRTLFGEELMKEQQEAQKENKTQKKTKS